MNQSVLPESLTKQLKTCRTLPSVPAVVLEVLEICQDNEVGIGQIAKVLVRDPALSGKILKVANSPYYGAHSEVTTLERAVTILGINATLSLALSFSLVKGLQKQKTGGFDHHAYWRRSVISAAASRVIGFWANTANSDELFLAGLLQDIGMLVMNEAMPESYGKLVEECGENHDLLAEMELQEYGGDHAGVGAWLMQRWNLPMNLQMSAATSHGATPEGEEDIPIFCRCVLLAGYIAAIWTQAETAKATSIAREKSSELFQMSAEQFEQLLNNIAQILPDVTENLEINIGGENYVEKIMDQARSTLVEISLHGYRTVQEIELQAKRDELTSLANRAYLNEILPKQFLTARETGKPFSILFIDIDRFKSINDTYGHQGGDAVIISVARMLRSCTREFDVVARYGGDEFVILLSNINESDARDLSRRIQQAIMDHPHTMDEATKITVTISIGCATMSADHPFPSPKELVEAADQCLYAAKTSGRNRVVSFDKVNSEKISPLDCAQTG